MKYLKKMPSWGLYLLFLVLIFLVLWILFGRGEYEYIGLEPLVQTDRPLDPFTQHQVASRLAVSPPLPVAPPVAVRDTLCDEPSKKISKGEKTTCEALSRLYGKPFGSVRPDFLKNPETGCNLEIDCYNEELKLGAEYSGIQHYVFPNPFHTSYEQFIGQVRRDRYKEEVCSQNGIYLIKVPYTVPHDEIEQYLWERLPENHQPSPFDEVSFCQPPEVSLLR